MKSGKPLSPLEAALKYPTFAYWQASLQRKLARGLAVVSLMGFIVGKFYQPWAENTLLGFIVIMAIALTCSHFANKVAETEYQQVVRRARAAGDEVVEQQKPR